MFQRAISRSTLNRIRQVQHILRSFNAKPVDKTQIPPPTWSIQDLHLSSAHLDKSISDEEYHKLAYRCLIDIRVLTPEQNLQLKQSLCDIMRCVSLVTDHNPWHDPMNPRNDEGTKSSDMDMNKMTLLNKVDSLSQNYPHKTRSRTEEQNEWVAYDRKEAEQVLQNIRQGKGEKLTRREEDGHWYFALKTGVAADENR